MKQIKTFVLSLIYKLGLFLGINKSYISILCYHSISDAKNKYAINIKDFEDQMIHIKQHANFISLDQIKDMSYRKNNHSVVLTIDDGYEDAKKILPITKKLNIPVTLFVLSSPKRANRFELNNKIKLLSFEEIRFLKNQGWIIGCHSKTHADLTKLSDKKLKDEIISSKAILEKKLGFQVDYFAYPKGKYNTRVLDFVKKAGFKAALSVQPGNINRNSNMLTLPRTVVEKKHQLIEFPSLFSPTSFLIRRLIDPLMISERVFQI